VYNGSVFCIHYKGGCSGAIYLQSLLARFPHATQYTAWDKELYLSQMQKKVLGGFICLFRDFSFCGVGV
jgi:hypothetical protein